MKLQELIEVLDAEIILQNHEPDEMIPVGGAADLMSDVLAFGAAGMALLTGLTNPQVVRTAEMAGINVIVLVRDKKPPPETVELARELGVTLVRTSYTMYESCGRLFRAGLPGLGVVKIRNDSW